MRETEFPLVLIVDDDPMVRFLAGEALRTRGFRLVETDNGEEALRLIQELGPDLILLDVMMPGIDGFTTCSRLRVLPQGKHIPVLMMTGLEDAASIQHAYQVGATDFITKPINFGLLEFRLEYMMRAKITSDELRQSEAMLYSAQRLAHMGHFVMGSDQRFSVWNSQTQAVLGLEQEPAITALTELLQYIRAEDREPVAQALANPVEDLSIPPLEYRIQLANGPTRTIVQHSRVQTDEFGIRVIGTVQDISERRQAERTIHQLAYFDQITGLPNRIQIEQRLSDLTRAADTNGDQLAVISLDLDHFQRVNDTFGHELGNELLRGVSRRLIQCLRLLYRQQDIETPPAEMVARNGGDEFCLLLTGIVSREALTTFTDLVRQTLHRPFALQGEEVVITASMGTSIYPDDGREPDVLLRHADIALYHAKQRGRDCNEFFDSSLNQRMQARVSLENSLRQALGTPQLSLHYQPKVNTETGALTGMEALVRWEHPTLGRIPPSDFIPVAEESGLILPLGEWILGEACRQTARWAASGLRDLVCAVNLSALQLRQTDFTKVVARTLTAAGLPASCLQLELTESVLMENSEHIRLLEALKDLGITLAVDDFGTGYSSLSYLTRLPIDVLKIDQSFVRELRDDGSDNAIVSAVIAMGHSLGLKIVAEGVEGAEQVGFLRRHRCDELQGYHFSKPLPAAQFEAWALAHQQSHSSGAA
jgi:diguanylate cyclase (GGDEF)-like protein